VGGDESTQSAEMANMMHKQFLSAAVLCLALAAPAAAGQLSANQLRGLAPGTYAVSILGLVKMTVNMQPGGGISGITSKKKRDAGAWSVQGEKLCIRWSRWLKGKTRCAALTGGNGRYSGGGLSIRKI
jgi:hypothetical protein